MPDGADTFHAYDRANADAAAAASIAAIHVDCAEWDEAAIPPRPWIAPGFLLRGAVTLLAGAPSALKSSTSLGWGASLALWQRFGRFHAAKPMTCIVYNVEDDADEQRRRLSATLRQFDAKPADLGGRLFRVGPSSIGTLLARDDEGKLVFTPAMDALEKLIVDARADVLIVDPLSELHSEEENDNTALRAVIANFRSLAVRHRMAVVILHHTRKGSSLSPGDPDTARGASSIIGAVRVALTLTTMSEEDAAGFGLPKDFKVRSGYVRMDDAKSNYAALREAEWFEKVAYLLDNGDTVAAAVPWNPPSAKVASLADLLALVTAIERGAPNGEPWSPRLSKDARSVRALLIEHGFVGDEAQKATLARLQAEYAVASSTYRSFTTRHDAAGLRVNDLPRAAWKDA